MRSGNLFCSVTERMLFTMQKSRNLGIDILCCFGVMLLLGLQYIDAVGYFNEPITSWDAAAPVAARWFCLSGAMVLSAGTGYALGSKKFSMGYFKIFIRLIYVYVLGTAFALLFRVVMLHEEITWIGAVQAFVQFTATDTGKFAGMYFALLLAAPFLNAAMQGLPSRQARLTFLIIIAAFSTLQPILWFNDMYLLPEQCTALFPMAAYIAGAYMKRYSKRKHVVLMCLILVLICAVETAAVMYASLTKGSLWCPWLDSAASLPCFGIAVCLLGIFHSKKMGKGSVHRFFAGVAGGALAALLLGDPLIDVALPAIVEQFMDIQYQYWAGVVIVPIIFILSCVLGLVLQIPLLGIRSRLRSEEAEAEEDEEEIPTRPRTKRPRPAPERRPLPAANDPRRSIRVAVNEPQPEVGHMTQPEEETPPGATTLPSPPPERPQEPETPEIPPERVRGKHFSDESPTMEIPAQKRRRPETVEEILGIPDKNEGKSTAESIHDLIDKIGGTE